MPVPDLDSAAFWAGLRRHRLLILRCGECRYWVHPPQASCPRCLSMAAAAEEVSGRGVVYSYTLAYREFAPGIKPPYAVALVDLTEQESLRLVTNLVNVAAGEVRIGMPVQVLFHDLDLGGHPHAPGDLPGEESLSLAFFEPVGP